MGNKIAADELAKLEEYNPEKNGEIVVQKTEKKNKGHLDDEVWERRISEIAKNYLKTSFFIDFMACVPVLIYEALYEFSTD